MPEITLPVCLVQQPDGTAVYQRPKQTADKAVLIPDEPKTITPEWLESKGFVRYENGKEYDIEHFLPSCFDVEFGDDDLCYIEAELDRKQFCIVLTPEEYTDGSKSYSFGIYIQEDIGCGFVGIPNQFCEMTEYHFSLLYEAIRREKL